MKILEISFHLQSGGAERFVVDLSNELAKTHDVTLLTLRDDTVTYVDRNFYRSDLSDAVKYDCLGLKNGLRPSMWLKIWKYIRDARPDVVHFHGDAMCYYMFVPILFSSRSVKFVQTLHSDFHWGGYDRGLNRLMANTVGRSKRLGYVALSRKNYDDLAGHYPFVHSSLIVNGRAPILPTPLFAQVSSEISAYRTSEASRILVHVARCSEVKNQTRLITAFNSIAEQGTDAHLLVIGDGYDSPLGREIVSSACDRVHFLGPRKNVSDYLLCSDIFCLSSDAEGMPISLLEALLSGIPVVSTPVYGALETVKEGMNGVLAKGFEVSDYSDALHHALSEFSNLRLNAEKIKEASPYTIRACAGHYADLYNTLNNGE